MTGAREEDFQLTLDVLEGKRKPMWRGVPEVLDPTNFTRVLYTDDAANGECPCKVFVGFMAGRGGFEADGRVDFPSESVTLF